MKVESADFRLKTTQLSFAVFSGTCHWPAILSIIETNTNKSKKMSNLEHLKLELRRMESAYDNLFSDRDLYAEYQGIKAQIAALEGHAYPAISQGGVVGPALVVEGVENGKQVFQVFKRDQVAAAKARAAGVLDVLAIPAGVKYAAKDLA